jgi:hypothetical protein
VELDLAKSIIIRPGTAGGQDMGRWVFLTAFALVLYGNGAAYVLVQTKTDSFMVRVGDPRFARRYVDFYCDDPDTHPTAIE